MGGALGVEVGSVSMFERFVAALDRTCLRAVIDRTSAFDDARAAWDHLASAQHLGKVVIRCA